MESYIEKQLRIKSENTQSIILYSQWQFDKELIPPALNAIANIFPHYSLHNETHSNAILSNITKLLGEKFIDELNCTDLWLLLESAYCHDIGMIISYDQAKEAIDSKEFIQHISKILNDEGHALHRYSKKLSIEREKILFSENTFEVEKIDTIRFLLADFFRTKHATLSNDYILNPDSAIALKSPRTIIPLRLYSILGIICSSHTKTFEEVMSIPYYEDGIDTENAHPRFIAYMLRIGDLLDIDNYRFSDTLLKTLSSMPDDSLSHKEKHLSINHKCINNQFIELSAKCTNIKVAKITKEWFDWIQGEITKQTLDWHNIIPKHIKGMLPKVKSLVVELEGYDFINNENKPSFTIDTTQALELLQGGNFYKDPFDAIREVIQNAVDSTLIRIWHEKGVSISNMKDLLQESIHYPININIQDNHDGTFIFKIEDKGTGISKHDFKYLSNTGSASKNNYRREIIDSMPIWMQPSGIFGIGFQSVFLLTDVINIETKSIFSDEKYGIEMYNPKSEFKGEIYIKPINSYLPIGTTIQMKVVNTNYISSQNQIVLDRFSDNENEYIFEKIIGKVEDYAMHSFIPITINGTAIERVKYDYVSDDNGIEIKFEKDKKFKFSFKNSIINAIVRSKIAYS
ncbi:Chaperone protein HtpG [termite gut metagenome]|uniref:Chaperone protein HtpG n=1 Tax=termite gut metagenome TaxID=433724 RepID=A0A5J4RU68_9ZZZZ